jgi:tetratricopeptide (TPR) repeat protein
MNHGTLSIGRRFAVAIASLAIAAVLFHGSVASALVTRGDDAMRAGYQSRALTFYRRALIADPHATLPADRLAFNLLLRHTVNDSRDAIAIASDALRHHPADVALLVDRALGEQRIGALAHAEEDFSRAGSLAHDARYEHFAGRIALRRGHRTAARRHFAAARADDPTFAPARTALAGLR